MTLKRRLLTSLLCLIAVVLLNFTLPRLMPGNPVFMLSGQDELAMTTEQIAQLEKELGIDRPVLMQLFDSLFRLLQGDLGYSYHNSQPVLSLILGRVGTTLLIALPALFLSVLIGCGLGCWCGWKTGSLQDKMITACMIALDAVPSFLLAMLLVSTLSFQFSIFPLGGLRSVYTQSPFLDMVWHLVLPVAASTLLAVPARFLVTKNAVAADRQEKYIVYALARGLSPTRVCLLHLFKKVSSPIIASIGLNIGFLLSGSMLIEVVFSLPGMGTLLYQAALNRDYPTLQGGLLMIACMVIIANILTDLACLATNPMQRKGVLHACKYTEV